MGSEDVRAGDGVWDDDEGREVLRRADRATRRGWTAIAGVTGLLGCALVTFLVVALLAVLGGVYVVMVGNR
ncbi:hypothetical protein [Streptomyces bikiniensis]|uniref:Integral membrane protein n=1 Tax=Streptomyces bikiniensis TaxID=1896 RepID=A0ABW8CSQ3_STRBI|nr:hypothetical protein [Streptomyces bikiniensis]